MPPDVLSNVWQTLFVCDIQDPIIDFTIGEPGQFSRNRNVGKHKGQQGKRTHPPGDGGDMDRLSHNIHCLADRISLYLQLAKIALVDTFAPIRVIDEPLVPRHPIAPNNTRNISVAGFLGLLSGTLLAFLVDYLGRAYAEQEKSRTALVLRSNQPGGDHADSQPEADREEDRNQLPPTP